MKIRIKKITDKTRATYLIPIDQVVEKAKAYKEKENKRIERKLKRIQEALKLVNESNGYTNNQITEKE
jgi:DhnA family fructose-bisphosphate aldolase class Ia